MSALCPDRDPDKCQPKVLDVSHSVYRLLNGYEWLILSARSHCRQVFVGGDFSMRQKFCLI